MEDTDCAILLRWEQNRLEAENMALAEWLNISTILLMRSFPSVLP